jgi:hypothetical protein
MKLCLGILFLSLITCLGVFPAPAASQTQKDYLSAIESDKIRDAETPNERITLFISFADDRLKKLQYELEHPSQMKHTEMMNSLLNAYVATLQKIPTDTPEAEMYKDNLDDAMEGTQDASKEAEAAKKNVAPPPVRRKK